MKEKFMTALGFSNDAETPITSDETPIKKAIFTDEFYRLEKIGIVARKDGSGIKLCSCEFQSGGNTYYYITEDPDI